MYGWINTLIERMSVEKFGLETWNQILTEAGCRYPKGGWSRLQYYPDDVTVALVVGASKVLSIEASKVMEVFGEYFIYNLDGYGYGDMMKAFVDGSSFASFLQNTNFLHASLQINMPRMQPPHFTVIRTDDEKTLIVLYVSSREGLAALAVGVLKACAKLYFGLTLTLDQIEHEQVKLGKATAAFKVNLSEGPIEKFNTKHPTKVTSIHVSADQCPFSGASLNTASMDDAITFHFDSSSILRNAILIQMSSFTILAAGNFFKENFSTLRWDETPTFEKLFHFVDLDNDWVALRENINSGIAMRVEISRILRNAACSRIQSSALPARFMAYPVPIDQERLLMFLSPDISFGSKSLSDFGLSIEDMPKHDRSRELFMALIQIEAESARVRALSSVADNKNSDQVKVVELKAEKDFVIRERKNIALGLLMATIEICDLSTTWIAVRSMRREESDLFTHFLIIASIATVTFLVTLYFRAVSLFSSISIVRRRTFRAVVPMSVDSKHKNVEDIPFAEAVVKFSIEMDNLKRKRIHAVLEVVQALIEDIPISTVIIVTLVKEAASTSNVTELLFTLVTSCICLGIRFGSVKLFLEYQKQINTLNTAIDEHSIKVNNLFRETMPKRRRSILKLPSLDSLDSLG